MALNRVKRVSSAVAAGAVMVGLTVFSPGSASAASLSCIPKIVVDYANGEPSVRFLVNSECNSMGVLSADVVCSAPGPVRVYRETSNKGQTPRKTLSDRCDGNRYIANAVFTNPKLALGGSPLERTWEWRRGGYPA